VLKARIKNVLIYVLAIAVFGFRYWFALPVFDSTYVGSFVGQNVTVVGYIQNSVENTLVNSYIEIKVVGLKAFDREYPLRGDLIVQISGRNFDYGDKVEVYGLIKSPASNDPRIAGFINSPNVRFLEKGKGVGTFFYKNLFNFKSILIERLNSVFPEPSASLAAGILLGSRSNIPKNILTDFKSAGVTHILAISGYNIVILIAFVTTAFSVFPKKIACICSIVVVCIFTLLVGASASVVRAAIMGSLSVVAQFFGRKSSGLRPLVVTAYIMALIDPFLPFYDIGFQLSFGATAGIVLFSKRIESLLKQLPETMGFKSSLATTWAAQAFTSPLIFFYFKNFSAIATISNLVILPAIPLAMLGSFLALITGKMAAAPTWILFELLLKTTHFFASLPFAFIDVGAS
jgi:competence protein ComEC